VDSAAPNQPATASANAITSATRAMMRRWIAQPSAGRGRAGSAPLAVCASSAQPIPSITTAMTKAAGISGCMSAAGTAAETTTVMMFSGLQQFITAKPRYTAIIMRCVRTCPPAASPPLASARATMAPNSSMAP